MPDNVDLSTIDATPPPPDAADLDSLLEYLKQSRGFDFTGYKRASLERRIHKRMQAVGVLSFDEYVDFLEVHPEEFAGLINTVLINVTSFFRDASAWTFIAESVIPDLLARRGGEHPIRIWSAGCASGEEAYTLAILFTETLGVRGFQDRVKIYATDVDQEALSKARQAAYTDREVADIPKDLRDKYFEVVDGRSTFRKDLRRHVIFGRHDLIQDAPISRVDLLVCRNTLMYFNAETQAKVLTRFQFALNDHGVLFLGRAETMMTHASAFTALDLKRRISTKVPNPNGTARERMLVAAQQHVTGLPALGQINRLRDLALDTSPVPQLLVDRNGALVTANERARALFGISHSDLSRPIQDLRISYRPVELRSALDQVYLERCPVVLRDVEWAMLNGEIRLLDVHVSPLVELPEGAVLGAGVSFNDVTLPKRLQLELEHTNQALETAYEELQSTNEELETTNEELQSTVEELEATNEELQSTNEELETMNEELQSTNEELHTLNDETRQRGEEINEVNSFLDCILTSLRGAVVVLDAELTVLVWNRGAEELWGLREDEVRGKNLLGLDIGLPTEQLKQPVRACVGGEETQNTVQVEAVNRRGRHVICTVGITPLKSRRNAVHGAILIMDEESIGDGDGHNHSENAPRSAVRRAW